MSNRKNKNSNTNQTTGNSHNDFNSFRSCQPFGSEMTESKLSVAALALHGCDECYRRRMAGRVERFWFLKNKAHQKISLRRASITISYVISCAYGNFP